MARFAQVEYSSHGGVDRMVRGLEVLASFSISKALLRGLALVGTPVMSVGAKVSAGFGKLAAARRQRIADDKLWNIALSDARVMADLSRAMSRDALSASRHYI